MKIVETIGSAWSYRTKKNKANKKVLLIVNQCILIVIVRGEDRKKNQIGKNEFFQSAADSNTGILDDCASFRFAYFFSTFPRTTNYPPHHPAVAHVCPMAAEAELGFSIRWKKRGFFFDIFAFRVVKLGEYAGHLFQFYPPGLPLKVIFFIIF